MEILFSIFALLILGVIILSVVLLLLFLAKKVGFISTDSTLINGATGLKVAKKIGQSLITRFGLVAALSVLMLIPLEMISDIVKERQSSHRSVLNDISNTWGHKQQLSGPTLIIPYTEKFVRETVSTDNEGNRQTHFKTYFEERTAIVLPETLTINAILHGHERARSIYKSLVYSADLAINGVFNRPNIEGLSKHIHKIHWDKAWVVLGISDTRAINKVSNLQWSTQAIDFEPGTMITELIKQGFHAPLAIDDSKTHFNYSLDLNINGSGGFFFEPFAKTTEVTMTSNWPHPSFQGSVLPSERNMTKEGFTASWSVPNLARNYPQLWTAEIQEFNVHEFVAGVNLFEPVSLYSQINRTIKYGILFIVLTYITFVIFELGIQRRLHLVQYGVIGLGLSSFYLALLALAEHTQFVIAYASAAGIISLMISAYAYSAVRSYSRSCLIFLLLAGLYSILYSLLKLEDYALLVGTSLLLVILAALMFFTRHLGKGNHE